MKKNNISSAIVINQKASYPSAAPFDASEHYPEFSSDYISGEENCVYSMVRQTLIDLKTDEEHINTSKWSPFRELIKPGDTVVIKPNLVLNTFDPDIQTCTTSHPSVLRPIIDYSWKALEGSGQIVVGDCPGAEADFDTIVCRTGMSSMITRLQERGVSVLLKDFRAVRVETENGIWVREQRDSGEAGKGKIVALDSESFLADERYKKAKFHGAGYDIKSTNRHHRGKIHRYCVSEDILKADVVISVPKFKTHRKAGITCCLKNLVGINADKNYLPHFSIGGANMGGDEMPKIPKSRIFPMRLYNWFREYILAYTWRIIGKPSAALLRFLFAKKKSTKEQTDSKPDVNTDTDLAHTLHSKISKQSVAAGAWPGNETICAMILDLNRIFLCCTKDGTLTDMTDRKIFYIVDAIDIGVGNGPTHPIAQKCGIVAAGLNGFELDKSLLYLFGIDCRVIPLYRIAEKQSWIHKGGTGVVSVNGELSAGKAQQLPKIKAPDNWDFYPIVEEIAEK